MNEPVTSINQLAFDLLVGTKTLDEIAESHGDEVVKRLEEVIRTEYQYDCYGG